MRSSRLVRVGMALAIGLSLAWPFRQPPPGPPRGPSAVVPLELTLRAPDVTVQASPTSDSSPAIGLQAEPAPLPRASEGPGGGQLLALENMAPPPELPVSFQMRSSESSTAYGQPAEASPSASNLAAQPARESRQRNYVVRDGDTLESLAERFLGSRERAMEIFQANRSTLARPDLLPVGTTIVMPPRQP